MSKKKKSKQQKANKKRAVFGKPKGLPPQALRSKKTRAPKAVKPPPRDVGLLDAIGEVMSEVETLAEEMRSWADGMEEKFGSTNKFEEVSQAADTLEEQAGNDPVNAEVHSFLNDVKITIQDPTPKRRGYSRAARLGQAQGVLMDVVDALQTYMDDNTNDPKKKETAEALKDELDNIDNELQGVDFPGMY